MISEKKSSLVSIPVPPLASCGAPNTKFYALPKILLLLYSGPYKICTLLEDLPISHEFFILFSPVSRKIGTYPI